MNHTEIYNAYLGGNITVLSPFLKSLIKDKNIFDITVDIATIICNKYNQNISYTSELMTEATLALYLYVSQKVPSIFANYDFFQQRLNERLHKIIFVESIDNESTKGKSMGGTIYLKKNLLENDNELLSIFSHELAHILSSSKNYIGIIQSKNHGNSALQKTIQESFSSLSPYWYLNEMITEFVATSSLNNILELPDTDCNFKLNTGQEILVKNKCTSYKDIVHYMYPINYIFQNNLQTIYFSDTQGYRDIFMHKNFAHLKMYFKVFYTIFLLYNINTNRKGNNRYMKNQDVRSHKLFFCLQNKFKQFIAKFEQNAILSQDEHNRFISSLTESKIFIDNKLMSMYEELDKS